VSVDEHSLVMVSPALGGCLEAIGCPADLRALPAETLPALSGEIRQRLITEVGRTGGHLGPNLGVVELTIALHRVFDSPRDAIVWDTGHQSYVHKMLTGRARDLPTLRRADGLSGYPRRRRANTIWSRIRTPPPHCPMRTAWPRRSPCRTGGIVRWSRSSATER
jgi:hypothetical protein